MKNILFIAPASYPVNGAENIVNIKLLKALCDAGFKIDLISKKNINDIYPSATLESLGIKLNSINIIEVDNQINIITIFQHLMCFVKFGMIYIGSHWAIKALPIAKKLIKNNHYDYVLTRNPPAEIIGFYLKKKYNLKWIATWNDPYPRQNYPEPYGKGIYASKTFYEKRLISVISKYVDIHIFPNLRERNYMNQYLNVNLNKTLIIPHIVIENIESKKQSSTLPVLKMIHSGNLKYPRDPIPFLKALHSFIQKRPDSRIQISFLGVYDALLLKNIEELQLETIVKFIPPVDYFKSLELLSEYDIAMIIEANCKEGIFLPSKVADYLQYNKKIFAISPNIGVLNDLYKESTVMYFANCINPESIEVELSKIYYDFENDISRNIIKIPKEFLPENIVAQYDCI